MWYHCRETERQPWLGRVFAGSAFRASRCGGQVLHFNTSTLRCHRTDASLLRAPAVRAGSARFDTLGMCRPRSPPTNRPSAAGWFQSPAFLWVKEGGDRHEGRHALADPVRFLRPADCLGDRGQHRGRCPTSLSPQPSRAAPNPRPGPRPRGAGSLTERAAARCFFTGCSTAAWPTGEAALGIHVASRPQISLRGVRLGHCEAT
jgi:hypothetical protein